ncbi:LTA synthase family protein [Butyrivibrio sp. FCS006]|uniref:LTA synthase family protein n=1 Tax=Butyrivibrio sp. FCS006 TaxID=1280684 RepID=UPI0018C9EEB8|nr:LTA synthase family protein [Butyrivibrio sp. FCS006]
MKKCIEWIRRSFLIVLPLFFILFFFGYFNPEYDIKLYIGNVVGDGEVRMNLSAPRAYDYYYDLYAPLNSKTETVIVDNVHYDVEAFAFIFSSVSEMDLLRYEVRWLGFLVAQIDFKNILPPGDYERVIFSPSGDGQGVHALIKNPESDFTLKVRINYVPLWMWAVYWISMIIVTILLSVGLGIVLDHVHVIYFPLASLSAITATILAGIFFCRSFADAEYISLLLNIFLLFGITVILWAISTPLIGTFIAMVGALLYYIANYFIILFRGRPVMPADFAAINTAKEVAGGYTLVPSWQMILGVVVCIIYLVWLIFINKTICRHDSKLSLKNNIIRRAIAFATGAAIVFICISNSFFAHINSSAWDNMALLNFHKNGMLLTFFKYAKYSNVDTPEGYNREIVNSYLDTYRNSPEENNEESGIQPTNIIMVMNEAFSDLRTSGMDDRIDVMPFIDSLQENTLEGKLYVSVIGGGTCNTEFEALTGNSLSFLGVGAYPYSQHVNNKLFSLASYFESIGYISNAFHANEAKNWNRDKVYPLLGFEKFYALDDYPETDEDDYLHGYLSDKTNYLFLEDIIEQNSGKERFSFNVTMQNHSGYDSWDNIDQDESVMDYGAELARDAQVYLSLIKASDDAVKQLVEKYKDSDEPTMIIFFGDHQPALSYDAGVEIYGDELTPISLQNTKFFIWTNYESDMEHGTSISANFLPLLVLERGNFTLPPYIKMLKDVHEKYPIITSAVIMDDEGNSYSNISEILDDPLIRMYQYVQYANLFDEIDPAWFEISQSN